MSYTKPLTLCAETWCRTLAVPGAFKCPMHLETATQDYRGPRRYQYRSVCASCGRGEWLPLTEEEAAALKPALCAHGACGGRMRVDRDDVGHLGSAVDPTVPTRLDTRPGHKAARS